MERADKVIPNNDKPAKFSYSAIHEKLENTGFTLDPNNREEIEFLRNLYPKPSTTIGGTLSKSAKSKIATITGKDTKKDTKKPNPCRIADSEGNLPIHTAAIKGFSKLTLEIASLNGYLIDNENSVGKRPLDLAIQQGHIKTAIQLISLDAHCSLKSFITLFDKILSFDNTSKSSSKGSNKKLLTPEEQKSKDENKKKSQEQNINQVVLPAFYLSCNQAIREFKFKLVSETLLEISKKIQLDFSFPNKDGSVALHYAAAGSYRDFLLDDNSDLTADEAKERFEHLLDMLSNSGKLLTAKNERGQNILHISAQYGEIETAKLILDKTKNQLLKEKSKEKDSQKGKDSQDEYTPVDIAFIHGHRELANMLYDYNKNALSPHIIFAMIGNFFRLYSPLRGINRDKFATNNNIKDAQEKRNKAILDGVEFLYKSNPSLFTKLKNNDNILHFAISASASTSASQNPRDLIPIIQWCENHNLKTLFEQKNHENKNPDEIAMKIYQKTLKQILTLPEIEQQKQQPEKTETPSSCTLS